MGFGDKLGAATARSGKGWVRFVASVTEKEVVVGVQHSRGSAERIHRPIEHGKGGLQLTL
jgi:hypothetical protein